MSKFTIFSIILSVSVITVTADLVVRDYFGEGVVSGGASVLGPAEGNKEVPLASNAASQKSAAPGAAVQNADTSLVQEKENPKPSAEESEVKIVNIPSPKPVSPPSVPAVTEERVRQAGFTGKFGEKLFNGKVYQLIDISAVPVESIGFYEVSQDIDTVASITEITLRDEIRALQLYTLLQNKTKTYIDLSLNETNAYGERSFYINHAKKTQEAFLTVKIGKKIYAFAYVKFYHPELKKFITLLNG
ncbi:hypothetical protein HYV58_00470 [Candidatus Peregrinibacteria bacterium]|nr:hypothetical protein [Candidatus Peregrinibacteria bacterium]